MITRKAGNIIIPMSFLFSCSSQILDSCILNPSSIGKTKTLKKEMLRGEDSFGNTYSSIDDMWKKELTPEE